MIHEQKLDQIALLVVRLTMWSATRKASRETDLKEVSSALPPREVLSNGEIRLVAPEHMEWTSKFRKRLERLVKTHGTRTYAGDIIPLDNLPEIRRELDAFKRDLERETQDFLSNLPVYLRQWSEKNSEWVAMIDRTEVTADTVRNNFGFRFTIFSPGVVEGYEESMSDMLQSIGESVASEVATQVKPVWEKSLKGKAKAVSRTLNLFRQIALKLNSFKAIAPELSAASAMLDETLASIPKEGVIEGADFIKFERAVLILSDKETVLSYGNVVDEATMSPAVVSAGRSTTPAKAPKPAHVNGPKTPVTKTPTQPGNRQVPWSGEVPVLF